MKGNCTLVDKKMDVSRLKRVFKVGVLDGVGSVGNDFVRGVNNFDVETGGKGDEFGGLEASVGWRVELGIGLGLGLG